MQTESAGIVLPHARPMKKIDAILSTRAASTPATLLKSAADGTVVVPSQTIYCQAVPNIFVGDSAESNEVDNSAAPTTTSPTTAPTTTSPTTTPTNFSAPTPMSTTTTVQLVVQLLVLVDTGQPSSSRNNSRPQSRSTRNMAARLGGAKRVLYTLLLLAEIENCADERQQKWEERRRKQEPNCRTGGGKERCSMK